MSKTTAILICLLALCGTTLAAKKVQPVVDEEVLPYQFRTQRLIDLESEGELVPMRYTDRERMGAYEVANHWHKDTLSCIIFRHDLLAGSAVRQVNRNVWTFQGHLAADLNGDGSPEIAVTYPEGPDIRFEIIDLEDRLTYERIVLTCEDRNRNGKFETHMGNIVPLDVNADGCAECLMTVFSGFDLYPRAIYCLDWKKDSLLWTLPLTGLMDRPQAITDQNGKTFLFIAVSSMGNAVTAGTMDDRHSYLVCCDVEGNLVWTRTLGGIFSGVGILYFDSDADGIMEALVFTNPASAEDSSQSVPARANIRIFDVTGGEKKSLQLDQGTVFKSFITGDLNGDGHDEIIASTSDRCVTVYNRQLEELNRYEFPAEVRLWQCTDFLNNGNNQLVVTTDDGKTMLLSSSFRLLAQTDAQFDFLRSYSFPYDVAGSGMALLMKDRTEHLMHLLFLERQPFLTIVGTFLVRNQRTLYLVFAALIIALVFTNYHRRKIRRNLEVISSQRDELQKTGSELQKTLEDLKNAQTRLVQSEKMASLGKLVAGIAHEINSPLAAVSSSNDTLTRILSLHRRQLAQAGIDGRSCADLLKSVDALENSNLAIAAGAEKVEGIVRKLRSFARLDEAELQKVAVSDCLDNTLELLHPQTKQHVIVNKQYGDLPKITCYPGHLNQVFLNVLSNAVEAIRERGEITIKTYRQDGNAVVQIQDTGTGIASDCLDRIFDPGFTTKSRGVGTGMGLAIAYQIVRDHKGEISVDSEPGKGTTVTIKLPLELR